MDRRALITGITGQDGSYLAEMLLDQGYEVFGLVRRVAVERWANIRHLLDHPRLKLIPGDMGDSGSLREALEQSQPQEIYNLAAQSYVRDSWTLAEMTSDIVCLGVVRLLEAVRSLCPSARVYQASSSEMFGLAAERPQHETTPFYPRSPYAVAKVAAHWTAVNYRESFGMHISCGILFNHESPRRGREFVTQKAAEGAARVHLGLARQLALGNLHAERDWGFAGDYVHAMWLMLQQSIPEDYVVGTGVAHSVCDLLDTAFGHVGLDWHEYVTHDPRELRPAEVPTLQADPTKARERLGWKPTVLFPELVEMMVDAQVQKLSAREQPEKVGSLS